MIVESATQLFKHHTEIGVSYDNSEIDLEYRLKGLELGLQQLVENGIVSFQGISEYP